MSINISSENHIHFYSHMAIQSNSRLASALLCSPQRQPGEGSSVYKKHIVHILDMIYFPSIEEHSSRMRCEDMVVMSAALKAQHERHGRVGPHL
jgi:hypothetical protein